MVPFRFLFLVFALGSAPFVWSTIQAPSVAPDQLLLDIQQLIQQGNLPGARTRISAAIQRYPQEASLYSFLGVVDAQEKRYRQAEINFRKAITLSPQFQGPYLNLGHLYQDNQAADPVAVVKAIEVYEGLLKVDSNNQEAHYQLAVLLLGRSEYRASLDHTQRLPDSMRTSPQVLSVRCASLAALGRASEAEAVAKELLSGTAMNEADIVSILPTLEKSGFDSVQILLLEGLASTKKASPGTLHQLGLIYERQGQLENSRATLEKVAERQTITSGLLLELARIAYKQKDNKGALGYLAHAQDLDPRNPAIYFF